MISISAESQINAIDSVKLAGICKVWGLIKHYSNKVQRKKIEWDNVLITKYPEIKKSNNFESFNRIIIELLDTATEKKYDIKANKKFRKIVFANQLQLLDNFRFLNDTINNKSIISFSWINDSMFSEQVKDELIELIINYSPKRNKYLSGEIVVKHSESSLLELDSISEPYRALSLFRYWNNINYYFPYKKISDSNWDSVLVEFISPILNAKNYNDYVFQLLSLNSRINDSHGLYKYTSSKYISSEKNTKNNGRFLMMISLIWKWIILTVLILVVNYH